MTKTLPKSFVPAPARIAGPKVVSLPKTVKGEVDVTVLGRILEAKERRRREEEELEYIASLPKSVRYMLYGHD